MISPLTTAKKKTQRVQKDLKDVESELHVSNTVMKRIQRKVSDKIVDIAVEQTADAEKKVAIATKELEEVNELLEHTKEELQAAAGRRSGTGAASIVPHLQRRVGDK